LDGCLIPMWSFFPSSFSRSFKGGFGMN
jgi:hypothetical protein